MNFEFNQTILNVEASSIISSLDNALSLFSDAQTSSLSSGTTIGNGMNGWSSNSTLVLTNSLSSGVSNCMGVISSNIETAKSLLQKVLTYKELKNQYDIKKEAYITAKNFAQKLEAEGFVIGHNIYEKGKYVRTDYIDDTDKRTRYNEYCETVQSNLEAGQRIEAEAKSIEGLLLS